MGVSSTIRFIFGIKVDIKRMLIQKKALRYDQVTGEPKDALISEKQYHVFHNNTLLKVYPSGDELHDKLIELDIDYFIYNEDYFDNCDSLIIGKKLKNIEDEYAIRFPKTEDHGITRKEAYAGLRAIFGDASSLDTDLYTCLSIG